MPDKNQKLSVRKRLEDVLKYAKTHPYTSQYDLVDYLNSIGYSVDQSMVSRDLSRLGLAPYRGRDGQVYLGHRSKVIHSRYEERYAKLFSEVVLEATRQGNMVMLDALPGCGEAAATVVDMCRWPEVIGTFYGPRSISVITEDEDSAKIVLERIREGLT